MLKGLKKKSDEERPASLIGRGGIYVAPRRKRKKGSKTGLSFITNMVGTVK